MRKKTQNALYYLLIAITLIFISGTLLLLTPLIVFEQTQYTILILIILGISLGAFIQEYLKELDELTKHHHTGLISIVIIMTFLNFISLSASLHFFKEKNIITTLILTTIFTVSFLIPFIYYHYKNH